MRTAKGFTLIETLISIFLLVIVIIFIFSVFAAAQKGLALSQTHTNAAFLGRHLLYETASSGFYNMTGSSGIYTINGVENGQPYTQDIRYTVYVSPVDTDKKQAWVELGWSEKSGLKQVIIETLFTTPIYQ